MTNLIKIRDLPDSELTSHAFHLSHGGLDPEWDSFLLQNDGHHVQTGMWSEIKAFNGWTTKRITISTGSGIVGGTQLLIRDVRFVGPIGYIPKGPVLADRDDPTVDHLLERIQEVAQQERLSALIVQPQNLGVWERRLEARGFKLCPIETAPTATVLVELSDELDAILAGMTKSMRNGVRRGMNRGITTREGTRDDLRKFHKLLSTTGKRRSFSTFELDYFFRMWDILEPSGNFKLFLAELDGQAVSAQICIPFGNTVTAKQIGWSGEHRRLHPNEALDWFALNWAKDNGYEYYDLEGIERPVAEAILDGQSLPKEYAESPTAYKLRFGGQVTLYPNAYCFVANPILRSLYRHLGIRVSRWPVVQKAALRFRTG